MKKQLHQINDTQKPTPKQMLRMAQNIRSKYGDYACLEVRSWAFSTGGDENGYYIGAGHLPDAAKQFKTWEECLAYYHQLMKG